MASGRGTAPGQVRRHRKAETENQRETGERQRDSAQGPDRQRTHRDRQADRQVPTQRVRESGVPRGRHLERQTRIQREAGSSVGGGEAGREREEWISRTFSSQTWRKTPSDTEIS